MVKEDPIRELALFAGAGGGILGGILLGWRTVCAVEIDPYCRRVLLARQRDGLFPRFPIWDDIRTFDPAPWKKNIDIITGGFPCQDISCAGKGAGIDGEQSGLWYEMFRAIFHIRPRFAFVENVSALTARGLGRVLQNLAEIRYDARWCVLGTRDAGGSCWGDRIWILATPDRDDGNKRLGTNISTGWKPVFKDSKRECFSRADFMGLAPPYRAFGVDHRLAEWNDRVRAVGNGQDPWLVNLAWKILTNKGVS